MRIVVTHKVEVSALLGETMVATSVLFQIEVPLVLLAESFSAAIGLKRETVPSAGNASLWSPGSSVVTNMGRNRFRMVNRSRS